MSFEHRLTARFYEVDRAGIVFFGRFFEYCHAAFEELLIAAVGFEDGHFVDPSWGMPLVHAESDFERPVRMAERLTVCVDIERLGSKSITFAYVIRGDDGAVRARVKLVHAFIDMKTFESRGVPTELIDGLRKVGLVANEKPS